MASSVVIFNTGTGNDYPDRFEAMFTGVVIEIAVIELGEKGEQFWAWVVRNMPIVEAIVTAAIVVEGNTNKHGLAVGVMFDLEAIAKGIIDSSYGEETGYFMHPPYSPWMMAWKRLF